ncbi:MAG TPA: hypothetical protein VF116_09855 [Ktedonobacterales bacterium]
MDRETQSIPFDELVRNADSLFAEAAAGKRIIVEYDGRPYRIAPLKQRGRRKSRRFTANDPLFDIVGMGGPLGPGDVTLRVDDYLAEAYLAEFERPSSPGPDQASVHPQASASAEPEPPSSLSGHE